MTPHQLRALLQACKDAPDEDVPRLILADWLEEHGQADRAEFVRLQVRLAAGEEAAGDEAVTLARLHELYSRHAEEWVGGLVEQPKRGWGGRVLFRRGLLEVHTYLERLRDRPPEVVAPLAVDWLESLVLTFGRQKAIGELLALDALRHFTSLDLTDVGLSGPWLVQLGASPAVRHVRRLRLNLAGAPKAAAAALAGWSQLGGIRILEFPEGISDPVMAALAPWSGGLSTLAARFGSLRQAIPALSGAAGGPRLRRLDLVAVGLGKGGFGELAASPFLSEVASLELEKVDLTRANIGAFARSEWPRLERLALVSNELGDEGMRALAQAAGFRRLRHLTLTQTHLQPAGLRALLAAPWAAGLERLELDRNDLGDEGAEALAGAASLAGLRHLDLAGCKVGAKGVRTLANSPHLARLETLELRGNRFGDEGLAALAEARGWPRLTSLGLRSTGPWEEGLRRLSESALAGRLRHLELCSNDLHPGVLDALASPRFGGLKDLDLSFSQVGEQGAAALARGPFQGLVRLGLRRSRIGNKGLRALLATHGFPALAILDLDNSDITADEKSRILLAWPRLRHLAQLSAVVTTRCDRVFFDLACPVAFATD